MNKRSDWSTLVLFLVITIGVFVLWIGAMLGLGFALHLAQVDSNFWAMTEALATAVAMSAVVGAGFIAYRQLNENTKSRHLDVADRLFTELNAPENVQARRWVFQNLPADPVQGLASLAREERDHVKKVLNSLDRVAFLTQYVDYESQRRHEPDYYRSVRELAARCLAWRQQNLGEAPIVWVPDAL